MTPLLKLPAHLRLDELGLLESHSHIVARAVCSSVEDSDFHFRRDRLRRASVDSLATPEVFLATPVVFGQRSRYSGTLGSWYLLLKQLLRMAMKGPLKGMLVHSKGHFSLQAEAYRLLQELGASPLTKVYTAGGGAANDTWTAIRARVLGVPVEKSPQTEAAYGAALLARQGAGQNAAATTTEKHAQKAK
jgi:hypothetical protein